MAKPPDKNDKTQALSESQVVEVRPDVPAPKHDMSVWKGLVVGADEFAPAAAPKSKKRTWLVVAIVGVLAAGGGATYALWPSGSTGPKPSDAAVAPVVKPAPPPADAAPPDVAPADAAEADASPGDAAVGDAGVPGDAGAAAPGAPVKKTVKKKGVLRKPTKPIKKRPH